MDIEINKSKLDLSKDIWKTFKAQTEYRWFNSKINTYKLGYQIQQTTKWNKELTSQNVASLENALGFKLPSDYKAMLQVINGFDRDCIDVHGNDGRPYSYAKPFYQYPDDLDKSEWLIKEILAFRNEVNHALNDDAFDSSAVIGFVPIYAHRALVVFRDQSLSPVISIVGGDVIIHGFSLMSYLQNEFL